MEKTHKFESEAKLTLLEAIGIIIGHGVGAGILAVPYLASSVNWWNFAWIILTAYFVSTLLHLMIAELSYNNNGAMFVRCLQNLFGGRIKQILTIICFVLLTLNVLVSCCTYTSGGGAAIGKLISALSKGNWQPNDLVCSIIFYVFCALVVFFGMKMVGICEKYCTFAMAIIMVILITACCLASSHYGLVTNMPLETKKALGLFGTISFALSAVMSVPQAVKGLQGDKKLIRLSIICGIGITTLLVIILTLITIITCPVGTILEDSDAISDISVQIGGWVGVVGFIFTIFAMATSYWANSLDLRDIIHEQTNLGLRTSYILCTLPCLLLSFIMILPFVKLTVLSGAIQIFAALGIVVAYHFSRKRVGSSPLIGIFGSLPFQIAVLLFNMLATIGELLVL